MYRGGSIAASDRKTFSQQHSYGISEDIEVLNSRSALDFVAIARVPVVSWHVDRGRTILTALSVRSINYSSCDVR